MNYKILNSKKEAIAKFVNETDRDDFFDSLTERFEDCEWIKADE